MTTSVKGRKHHVFHPRPADKSYGTPQELFDKLDAEFHFEVDVAASQEDAKCSQFYTIQEDGLKQNWAGKRIWCNPPYNGLRPWVEKAYRSSLEGATVVMLLPVRSEVGYWHDIILPHAEIRFLKYIKFAGWNHTTPFPCCIAVFRPEPSTFTEAGRIGGHIAASKMSPSQRSDRARAAAIARWDSKTQSKNATP